MQNRNTQVFAKHKKQITKGKKNNKTKRKENQAWQKNNENILELGRPRT